MAPPLLLLLLLVLPPLLQPLATPLLRRLEVQMGSLPEWNGVLTQQLMMAAPLPKQPALAPHSLLPLPWAPLPLLQGAAAAWCVPPCCPP